LDFFCNAGGLLRYYLIDNSQAMGNLEEKQPVGGLDLIDIRAEELGRLFDKYHQRIYAYCAHRLFCRTAAEDVTSQIFLGVAQNLHSFQGRTESALCGWLYTIAVNQCNTYLRSARRRKKLFEQFQRSGRDCTQEPASPDTPNKPDWTEVYEAISHLSQIEQTVITLRFFEQMSYEQIAVIVSKREPNVRVLTHRGLQKLRKMLNAAWCGDE
jgi:RNA polymerase sigma factor (sigma-70 family)